jgi:hypothetical protein
MTQLEPSALHFLGHAIVRRVGPRWVSGIGIGAVGWAFLTLLIGPFLPVLFVLPLTLCVLLVTRSRRCIIAVDDRGVLVGQRLAFARDRIQCAYILRPRRDEVRVVGRRGLVLRVRLARPEDALALAAAIDRILRGARASYRIRHSALASAWMCILGGYLLAMLIVPLMAALEAGGIGALLGAGVWVGGTVLGISKMLSYGTIDVGRDGLLLRGLSWSRYVPYGELEWVANDRGRPVIKERGRRPHVLHLPIADGADEQQVCQTILRRIELARRALGQALPDRAAERLVAPAGRGIGQWVHDVRMLLDGRTYRELAVDETRLWRLVEDPAASGCARAGAALALARRGDTAGRLRLAADECADPKLRRVLTRVGEGARDEELEEALRPLVTPT